MDMELLELLGDAGLAFLISAGHPWLALILFIVALVIRKIIKYRSKRAEA